MDENKMADPRSSGPQHPSIKRATLLNLVGTATPAMLLLVTVPFYLRLIGDARYGVLSIVWLLLGYFGVFDLGFGRAVANRIAALDEASPETKQALVWTGLAISLAAGLAGGGLLLAVGKFAFLYAFHIDHTLLVEAERALPWLILALPVATMTSLLAGTLEGSQRFLELNIAQLIGTILYQLLPLFVASMGWITLPYLIPAAICGRVAGVFALLHFSYKHVPLSRVPHVDTRLIRPLLAYGSWISVTALLGPLLTMFDRFLIAAQVGMTAVATYTVPYNLVNYATIFPRSLTTSLFPRFSMSEDDGGSDLVTHSILVLNAIIAPIVTAGILVMKPFMNIWLGVDFATRAAPVGAILLLGIWINTLAFIPAVYLQGQGRPDLPAKFHVVELLPYGVILWLLISHYGVIGAAWAWNLRVAVDAILLFVSSKSLWLLQRPLLSAVPIIGAWLMSWHWSVFSVTYAMLGLLLVTVNLLISVVTVRRRMAN